MGVDLVRRINKKEVYGLTTPLITASSGEKMGKTNKGAVWLDENLLSSESYWQFWRNVEDKDVFKFLKLFTDLSLKEIENQKKNNAGQNINKVKELLANETTSICHGKIEKDSFEIKKEDIFEKEMKAFEIISINTKLITSKSEARRLIRGGGVKFNQKVIKDELQFFKKSDINNNEITVSIGKKANFIIKII